MSVKTCYKDCIGYDNTIKEIKSIQANGKISRWVINSFRKHEDLPSATIIINRKKEQRRKGNNYVYELELEFIYINGKTYREVYEHIYLKNLIEQRLDIIKTRIRQSHQERRL